MINKSLKKYKRSGSYGRDVRNRLKSGIESASADVSVEFRQPSNATANYQELLDVQSAPIANSIPISVPVASVPITNEPSSSNIQFETSMEKIMSKLVTNFLMIIPIRQVNVNNLIDLLQQWALKFNIAHYSTK